MTAFSNGTWPGVKNSLEWAPLTCFWSNGHSTNGLTYSISIITAAHLHTWILHPQSASASSCLYKDISGRLCHMPFLQKTFFAWLLLRTPWASQICSWEMSDFSWAWEGVVSGVAKLKIWVKHIWQPKNHPTPTKQQQNLQTHRAEPWDTEDSWAT